MKKTSFVLVIVLCFTWMTMTLTPAFTEEASAAQPADSEASPVEAAMALLEAGDYEAAIPILQEAADAGDPEAQNELGKCYVYGTGVEQSEKEAFRYFKMAADQGYARSLNNVGNYYAHGLVVDQDDSKAFECYKLAADEGIPAAQNNVGYYCSPNKFLN